jgi:uncharacterized protein
MLITFKAQNVGFYVKFNDTPAAQEILRRLPLDGTVQRWGDEIYFETGITASSEGQTMDVNVGDIAYWPEGKGLCVFFGPTEASQASKPVPASPVVIVGTTVATPGELREIKSGEPIRVFVMGKVKDYFKENDYYDSTRKLTQQEIDVLVKKILSEKASAN